MSAGYGAGPVADMRSLANTDVENVTALGVNIDNDRTRWHFHRQLNSSRIENELNTVGYSAAAERVAQSHSDNMAAHEYQGHVEPDGSDFSDRVESAGLGDCVAELVVSTPISEDVVAPWADNDRFVVDDSQSMARFLLEEWQNSPAHRQYLYSNDAEEVGLGINVSDDRAYATLAIC
jgi:uncharacterized protein YkwD